MNCPKCGCGYSLVVDCRTTGIAKRRRRKCSGCGHTFTTYEMFSEDYKKMTIAHEYFLKTIKAMEANDENRDY